VSSIDGVDAGRSPLAPLFAAAGFTATMHGLLRRGRAAPDAEGAAEETA
jgi:hypothetical protein